MNKTVIPAVVTAALLASASANAAVVTFSVEGTDAIFLAGRDDIIVPDPSLPWVGPDALVRHGGPTPEEAQETKPGFVFVNAGDVVRVLDPVEGGINFFNGFGPPYFGPEGNTGGTSNITSFGGISGYIGTQGALTGVFLDGDIPDGVPPVTLDFSTPASRDFLSISPELGQVFFIGNGQTSGGDFQQFIAPTGATRLFFGIPDGFGFLGPPGAYDDNDGSYRIRVGINAIPTADVPAPGALGLIGLGLAGLAMRRRRR